MGPDRPSEIDYYEDLGVERGASAEEIRDSFRALVRLLHPDHQQDAGLKAIAEKQLRKMNRIYAVLSDPERRRKYDLSLQGESRPPTLVFSSVSALKAKELLTRFVWIGTAVLGVAILIWLATEPPSAPVLLSSDRASASLRNAQPVASQTAAVPPAANSIASPVMPFPQTANTNQAINTDDVGQLRAALRAARSERDDARRELDELKSHQDAAAHAPAPAPVVSSQPLTSATTTLTDPAPPRLAIPYAAAPPPRKPALTEAQKFAGFWFFAKPVQANRNKNLYYPEFIEAMLTEQNGVIHGRYRSRYQIVDRAISPDVNFEFTGTPGSGTIVCPWIGQGGAKGQLILRITGENDMKVDWSASEIGSIQGLASGTATLTRRLE